MKANHSFSIGHKDDAYLIQAIRDFFGCASCAAQEGTPSKENVVRNPYGKFHSVKIYKKQILLDIIDHCTRYPLLGGKLESLKKLAKKLLEK